MFRLTIICLLIIVWAKDAASAKLHQEDYASQSNENASSKRTLIMGKLIFLPILAGVGVKFLILLPIILSKIALLGILSFVSSNLSLLVSAVMGARSYFFEDKSPEEEYEYDSHYKSRHEPHKPYKYISSTDPHDDHYDPHKYTYRYKGYEFSHPAYNSYYPEYKYHNDRRHSKKKFRPFKLFDKIKAAIKAHFYKSDDYGEKSHDYDSNYKYHSHDLSDDHDNEFTHEMHDSKYQHSNYDATNHQLNSEDKFPDGFKVSQDWSHKNVITSNRPANSEKHQDHVSNASVQLYDDPMNLPPKGNSEKSIRANPNYT